MALQRKRISRQTTFRANVVLLVFCALAVVLIARLFRLQVIEHEDYKRKVQEEITVETTVNPERGMILASNGDILATGKTVYLCFVSPADIVDLMAETGKMTDKEITEVQNEAKENGTVSPVKKTYSWTSEDGKEYKDMKLNEFIATFLTDELGETYGVEYENIIEKEARGKRLYEEIAQKISEESAERIRKFIKDNGFNRLIYLRADSIRYYPHADLASHVIGFTDSDGVGRYGLEAYYNNILEGKSGRYVTAQDARHNEMDYEYETFVEAQNGGTIVTTIDPYIQTQLENELEATMKENKVANRATGIVMNVNTGGILGMATSPSYNCNDPYKLSAELNVELTAYSTSEEREEDAWALASAELYKDREIPKEKDDNGNITSEYVKYKAEVDAYLSENHDSLYERAYSDKYFNLLYEMWKNKAITELYEPGSTSKIITTAMAFEENVVRPTDMFTCGGSLTVEGYPKPIHCHERAGHGTVTFARGLQQSCNPTLMQVAFKIGRQKYYDYFLEFGYGDRTGIDLPGEAYGIYHKNFEEFSNVSLAVYSFGQTYKTTPLQQLTAISAVANGGYVLQPHVIKEITDKDGKVIETFETNVKRQVVSEKVCKTIAGILEEGVATDGGAKNARVKGYKVAAKTGTSEKIDVKDTSGETYLRVGSCVAFAPADDPEIAVIIVVDEPMGGSVYGSVVAAPYVSDLLSNVLPYLGYEPQYTAEELEKLEVSIIDYTDYDVTIAKSHVTNKGMRAIVIGNGDTVTGQIPPAGSTVSKEGGKVILYTAGAATSSMTTVPDVIGRNAESANMVLTDAGLNVTVSGAESHTDALIVSQSIEAGTEVPEGTVVEIVLRVTNGVADD